MYVFDFRRKLRQGTELEKSSVYRTHCALARASLESFKVSGNDTCRSLYCCLSHLAAVPELDINLAMFDDLMFRSADGYDTEILVFAESKVNELEVLLECA